MAESETAPGGAQPALPPFARAWTEREPGRLLGRGHPAGDFLEAYAWQVLAEEPGRLRVRAHLPEHVKNPRGQLFGGFTPTYVDLVALFTFRAGEERREARFRSWLATVNMRLDYFEPVTGPEFVIESRVAKRRGRTGFIETRFHPDSGDRGGGPDPGGPGEELAVLAFTTLREVPLDRPLGDV